MSFEEFQYGHNGGHLGYRNWIILAILNLYNTPMPPIKFPLNLTYGLGDVVWRISPWQPPWISERNRFSNSESLCCSNASHQVLAQSDLWFVKRCRLKNFKISESLYHCDASHQVLAQFDLRFGRRCCLKNFKMVARVAILDIGMERFKQCWISMLLQCLPSSFGSIWLMVWEEMWFVKFQDGPHCGHLEYQQGMIIAILNLCITVMLPIKFWLNLTYGLGGDVVRKISRWLSRRPSWISEGNDFSNSESLSHCDASRQVLAQSDLRFGRCRLKNLKMAAIMAILDIWTEPFLQF